MFEAKPDKRGVLGEEGSASKILVVKDEFGPGRGVCLKDSCLNKTHTIVAFFEWIPFNMWHNLL